MKRIHNHVFIFLLLLILTHYGFTQSTSTNEPINWYTNLDFAKATAQEYKKPLFLFFIGTQPSALSNSVYNSTLSNEIIVNKINNQFIPVKIQGDNILQREYNVNRFPTLLILNYTDNSELSRLSGIISSDNVFALLDSTISTIANDGVVTTSDNMSNANSTNTIQSVTIYKYDAGAFLSLGDEKWIHSTPLYPRIDFSQFNSDDKYIMLANRELNVYFAIPIKGKGTFWTLKKAENEDDNAWVVAGKITMAQNGTVFDYIKDNSLIGQENEE